VLVTGTIDPRMVQEIVSRRQRSQIGKQEQLG
jgi:hypothetical protein